MTRAGRALTLATVLLAGGCEELGNPSVSGQTTPPTTFDAGSIRLVTRSISVPPSRSNELLRLIAPATPHHLDFFAPEGGVVTLVVVTPELRGMPRVTVLPLATVFRLRDGSVVRREWAAPIAAPAYYAGFGLPAPPVEATTAVSSPLRP